MLSVTTFFVISLKVTRFAFSSSSSKSSLRCQEMASPSRSGSVARYTVEAALDSFFSSFISSRLSLTGIYCGSKPCSISTPILLLGRSRRCPMDAVTLYPLPRYFSIVLAFAGDSTMTSSFAFAIAVPHFFAVFNKMRLPASRRTKPFISKTVSWASTAAVVRPVVSIMSSICEPPGAIAFTIFNCGSLS